MIGGRPLKAAGPQGRTQGLREGAGVHERMVLRGAVAAGLACLLAAGSAAGADAATLKGSRPSWANAKHLVKPADPAGAVNFRVYLGWRDGAEAVARAVSD